MTPIDMTNHNQRLIEWAIASGIATSTTPEKQKLKFLEEVGEFAAAVNKGQVELSKRELVDVWVTMCMIELVRAGDLPGELYGDRNMGDLCELVHAVLDPEIDLHEERAYALACMVCDTFDNVDEFEYFVEETLFKLEARLKKGKMVNGIFVKGEDL